MSVSVTNELIIHSCHISSSWALPVVKIKICDVSEDGSCFVLGKANPLGNAGFHQEAPKQPGCGQWVAAGSGVPELRNESVPVQEEFRKLHDSRHRCSVPYLLLLKCFNKRDAGTPLCNALAFLSDVSVICECFLEPCFMSLPHGKARLVVTILNNV